MIRKTWIHILLGSIVLSWAGCSREHVAQGEDHGHVHTGEEGENAHEHETDGTEKITPGPNGGRIITSVTPNIEFLVRDDRSVQLTFVDEHAKPIEATDAVVSLVGGDRSDPTELTFAVEENTLVSSGVLPEGEVVGVILTIQAGPEAAAVIERFNVDFATCSGCQLVEYACICNH